MAIARSKLTAQGQISIPISIRRKLGVDDRAGWLECGLHGGENVVVIINQKDAFAIECHG